MRFTKDFNLSVRCVRCGEKLDCVLEDVAEKYDFVVLVDRHNCKAVEHRVQRTAGTCPDCGALLVFGGCLNCLWLKYRSR